MSELIAVAFGQRDRADIVLNTLRELESRYLIDLEDACVVVRHKDGNVKLKQAVNLEAAAATSGALTGGLLGGIIGLLFLNPLVGFAADATAGAAGGVATDFGIKDDFMRRLGKSLRPDSSALFMLVRSATYDKVMEEFLPLDGEILHASLSRKAVMTLLAMLRERRAAASADTPPRPDRHPDEIVANENWTKAKKPKQVTDSETNARALSVVE